MDTSCTCLSDAIQYQISSTGTVLPDTFLDIVVLNSEKDVLSAYENYTRAKQAGEVAKYMNTSELYPISYRAYSYSTNKYILSMPLITRMQHNVTHNSIFIPTSCFVPRFLSEPLFALLIDLNTVILNQLIRMYKNRPGNLEELTMGGLWEWLASQYEEYTGSLYKTILNILRGIVAYGMASVVCSIMTRIGLMASSVIVLLFGTSYIEQ